MLWPWILVLSQEHRTSLQQWNKSQGEDPGVKNLHCQRTASLSPSEGLLQNRTRVSQLRYFKETPVFSVLMTSLHESLGNSMGHSLSWVPCYYCLFTAYQHLHVLPQIYSATSYLHCVWSHALYCLPIRNVSMISLFTCTPTPGSGNASTIILTMLISKRKGLTLLQNKILPEACNFFLSGVFTVRGLLCALGILTVPVISPEYLQCNGKMLSSHPSLYHLSKYLCCFCGKFFYPVFTGVLLRFVSSMGKGSLLSVF